MITEEKKKVSKAKSVFETLSAINVNEYVEKKNGLTYLSWAWAWSGVKKIYPNATYKIGETDYDEQLGFMCHSEVTIEGETLEMWLPVMDGANKSMKKEPYTYKTKWGEKSVEAATSFDVNKTIMRCLVKNLAMFGFGIYIYAGEDLPEDTEPVSKPVALKTTKELKELTDDVYASMKKYISDGKYIAVEKSLPSYKVNKHTDALLLLIEKAKSDAAK